MGIVYQSPRQTADIDFTADFPPSAGIENQLRSTLDAELKRVAPTLGYPDLVCCVQAIKRQPRRDNFEEANFPALDVNIAYANRHSGSYKRLQRGECPDVLRMEISFREPVRAVKFVRLSPEDKARVGVYGLTELVAEKLRSLLQQVTRGRNRRQDIYDVDYLIRAVSFTSADEQEILDALLDKSRARDIEPTQHSMDDPEVRRRAKAEWETLKLEVGDLPAFDKAFDSVVDFYRALPW